MCKTDGTGCEGENAYLTRSKVYSPVQSGPSFFLSFGFSIRNAQRSDAAVIHSESEAMYIPGHTLLPKPNAAAGSGTSGSSSPLSVKNRSGINLSGSGYTTGSCSIAL